MGIFDLSQKNFLNQYKSAAWRSDVERKEAVAAVRASGKFPFRAMINIIQTYHPSESNKEHVRMRMACLEELVQDFRDPSMIVPLIDILKVVDSISRAYLTRILQKLYQKDYSDVFVDQLRSENSDVRKVVRDILTAVGGRTVFELIKQKVLANNFQNCEEVCDVLVEIAGHHAIEVLKLIAASKNLKDRLHALELLANPRYMKLRKRKALEAAYEFVQDPESLIRMKVVEIINQHGDERDIPVLAKMLLSEEKRNLQAVIEAIGKVGTAECIPELLPFLDSKHTAIKVTTILTLGQFEDDRSIEPLIDCLRDKNLLIRQKTIEVLGRLGLSEKVRLGRLLVAMMKDKDVNVRRSVIEVIKIIGEKEELWWKLIRFLRDEDWWVRERVTEVLAEIGGPKIVDPIISLLDDPYDVVRRYAIEVLMRLKEPKAVPRLIESINDPDWWVRERAVEALAEIGDQRAIPYLNKLVQPDSQMILTVLTSLQKFGHKSSYVHLLQMLDHPLQEVRVEVIRALHAIGEERFGDTLKALINDESKMVRDCVLELLPKYNLTSTGVRRKTYEQVTMALLDQMLIDVKARDGEDLFIIAGQPPYIKIRGDVEKLDEHVFSEEDTHKLLFDILSPIQREQFENNEDIDMSYSISGEGSRFRVNVYRTRSGIGAVFRVLSQQIRSMEELDLPKPVFDFTQLKQGLILVTGPTGSGKSTTLAAMIDYMNRTRYDHIVTIEDPIEYVHSNKKCIINQREVGTHTLSFANALKSALREDPDIILVGEMRDLETISIAITAAETGHLVLGTLHTVSAAKTIDRIIDVFPGRQQEQVRAMLSESLRGVLSQQLLKRKDLDSRVLVMELMICNDAIANLIRKEKNFQIPSILTTSFELGMRLMDNELMRLVKEEKIYPEDAYIKSINKKEFEKFLNVDGNLSI